MKTHKVGSITFGSILIIFGTLFLLNTIFHMISYEAILKVWPIVFIGLGIEVLIAHIKCKENFVYDWAAVWLMMITVLFGMGMSVLEMTIRYRYFI